MSFITKIEDFIIDNIVNPVSTAFGGNPVNREDNWVKDTVEGINNTIGFGAVNKAQDWIAEKIGIGEEAKKIRDITNLGIDMTNPIKEQTEETIESTGGEPKNEEPESGEPNKENISESDIIEELKKYQKHIEEREDTAYQRAIEDMRNAGINPNLMGSITPASASNGIIGAMTQLSTNYNTTEIQQLIADINRTTDISENKKDRISDILKTFLMFKFIKK